MFFRRGGGAVAAAAAATAPLLLLALLHTILVPVLSFSPKTTGGVGWDLRPSRRRLLARFASVGGDGADGPDDEGGSSDGVDASPPAKIPPPSSSSSPSDVVVDAAAFYVASSLPSSSLLGVRSVGVDFGLIRTGLAVTVGYDPEPLAILSDLNETEVVREVIRRCESEGAGRVVVGLPLHKNGTESERSGLTRRFATELACACRRRFGPDFPVHLWDERYTSKEAAARAAAADPRAGAGDLRGSLDADAACIILEHYYADAAEGAERAEVPEEMAEVCDAAWAARREEEERAKRAVEERRREGLDARRLAMERAAAMEREMAERGELGMSRKKAKKKKKKQKKKKKKSGGGENWIVM